MFEKCIKNLDFREFILKISLIMNKIHKHFSNTFVFNNPTEFNVDPNPSFISISYDPSEILIPTNDSDINPWHVESSYIIYQAFFNKLIASSKWLETIWIRRPGNRLQWKGYLGQRQKISYVHRNRLEQCLSFQSGIHEYLL